MLNFTKILFPVDFSEAATQTAPFVADLAHKFKSRVILLHALDLSMLVPDGPLIRPEARLSYRQLLIDQREADLESFATGVFEGLEVLRIAAPGEASGVIKRYVETNEAGLVVMPTHGLGIFRWLLLGSVTTKVLHDLACPVITTVHSETLAATRANGIHTVVCGIDLCSEPARVLRAASEIASAFGSRVKIVHAIPAPEAKSGSNVDPGLKRFLFDTAQEKIAECQQQAGTAWEVFISGGNVSCVLRHAAAQANAGLTVIGRGHLQEQFGRFRTHVGAIIRDAPCPVLSV